VSTDIGNLLATRSLGAMSSGLDSGIGMGDGWGDGEWEVIRTRATSLAREYGLCMNEGAAEFL
jgi:hypothetical protein